MTTNVKQELRTISVVSADGTPIAYTSLGVGPGLIIVGGVLSSSANYLPLARILASEFEVHVMNRRGRPGSGPQRAGHSIDDECADLVAVAAATGATAALGHSFGGLVTLETARRWTIFDKLFVYEPGIPLRHQLNLNWLEGYQRLLERGDRRGAFAWMVKNVGFAPWPLAVMPLGYVRGVLRLAIRGQRWASMNPLLEANLVEHRILAALDAPSAQRFATVTAPTVLLGGAKSPDVISRALINELATVIPNSTVAILPKLGHPAPEEHPKQFGAALLAHRLAPRDHA